MPNQPASTAKGQSLVEFALTATLLIFVLMATADFGLAFLSWITLRDAAQEGATYGSIFPPYDSSGAHNHTVNGATIDYIRARARDSATWPVSLATDRTHVSVSLLTSGGLTGGFPCQGNSIQVTVVYDYHFVSPMIGKIFGNGDGDIPVSASVTNTILLNSDKTYCESPHY